MSIKFTAASTEYLQTSSNLIGSDIFTMACWFYLESQTGADQDLVWSGSETVAEDDRYHRLQYDDSGDQLRFSFRNGATNHCIPTNKFNTGAWNYILGYRASATDAQAFLNGDEGGSNQNTTSVTGTDADTNSFAIGQARDFTPTDPNDGKIAHVAIWNIALENADDRIALAAGVAPWLIQPQALIRYFPMNDILHLTDVIGGVSLTAFNTPSTDASNPPVVMPSTAKILQFDPVVSGDNTIIIVPTGPTVS